MLRIIQSGRREGPAPSGRIRAALLPAAFSALLLWACFTPLDWAPLGWVALVPLLQVARAAALPRRCGLWLWLAGFLGALATLQWMRLGHPAMYLALVALAGYLGCYFPAFVWLVRRRRPARGRRSGSPLPLPGQHSNIFARGCSPDSHGITSVTPSTNGHRSSRSRMSLARGG
ncbi:MAG UNVERIFIED_CONTAM: hypothetical protein LVR18_40405 [Planctomycetaceae bacterium]